MNNKLYESSIAREAGRTIRSALSSWARTTRLTIIMLVVPLAWHMFGMKAR